VRPPQMTTRRWMAAIAIAAMLLAAGIWTSRMWLRAKYARDLAAFYEFQEQRLLDLAQRSEKSVGSAPVPHRTRILAEIKEWHDLSMYYSDLKRTARYAVWHPWAYPPSRVVPQSPPALSITLTPVVNGEP
jgi:hypothetical protein